MISISTFVYVVERQAVTKIPMRIVRQPVKFCPCRKRISFVTLCIVVGVCEKSVVVRKCRRNSISKIIFCLFVKRNLCLIRRFRVKFCTDTQPLPRKRRKRVNVHYATVGISAVKRSLWSTEHVDSADVEKIKVEGVFVHHGNIVDVQTHCRLVNPRSESTYVD